VEIYEPLNQSLHYVGALMNAAEAHGLLCGMLCIRQGFSIEECFKHIMSQVAYEDGLATECQQQLTLLKNYTVAKLNSATDEFQLLLPPEDTDLAERVQALAGWCEGFSFGLGIAGIQTQSLSADAEEFIKDTIAISHLAPVKQATEAAEADYIQLVEYIKVGVITLYEEIILAKK
jgi:yecA family protein